MSSLQPSLAPKPSNSKAIIAQRSSAEVTAQKICDLSSIKINPILLQQDTDRFPLKLVQKTDRAENVNIFQLCDSCETYNDRSPSLPSPSATQQIPPTDTAETGKWQLSQLGPTYAASVALPQGWGLAPPKVLAAMSDFILVLLRAQRVIKFMLCQWS